MLLANEILGPELAPKDPIAARPGEPVELHEFGDLGEAVAFLSDSLRNLMAREPTASCAVIARHPEQADAYYDGLKRAEVPAMRRIRRDEFNFQAGIDITDVAQVKGLEFDYVVMVDVNASSYPDGQLGASPAAHRRHARGASAVDGHDRRAVAADPACAARRRPDDLSGDPRDRDRRARAEAQRAVGPRRRGAPGRAARGVGAARDDRDVRRTVRGASGLAALAERRRRHAVHPCSRCGTILVTAPDPCIHRRSDRRAGRSILAFVDYTAITLFAWLDVQRHAYQPEHQAIAGAILLTFAVARLGLLHVVWSLVLAEISLWTVAIYADGVGRGTLFIAGGLMVLAFMIALTNVAVRKMFGDLRRRDNLTRFLPQQVVDRVIAGGTAALAPVQREVSVLFSDIRGFTGLSEKLEPRALLAMLDDYFGRMGQIVKGHDGVIGKFIGDGLLAYWGVPDTLDGHAAKAVAAARDMQRALVELNRMRVEDGLAPIKIGIGIHTGVVAAGMMGGASQSEYTVIGDAVNVASRIEGLTKEHAAGVLISETTWSQLPEPRRGRRIDGAEIRGRKEPIALYALDDA